jgi:hypothetical protein
MINTGSISLISQWLNKPRTINWAVKLGFNTRKKPLLTGSFSTTLSFLDDQGEKWGDTYVKVVGQHYDDYAHWSQVSQLLPIGGISNNLQTFVPNPFTGRQFKGAAPGVTGLIGEVLVTVFLQKEIGLSPLQIAHLMDNTKAPDLCLDIQPSTLARLFQKHSTNHSVKTLLTHLNGITWPSPLPMECKSRRDQGSRQIRTALHQLLAYWRQVPKMAGHGIIAQIDVLPQTIINLHLIIPKISELNNVQSIISGQGVQSNLNLPTDPKISDFDRLLGGRIVG